MSTKNTKPNYADISQVLLFLIFFYKQNLQKISKNEKMEIAN